MIANILLGLINPADEEEEETYFIMFKKYCRRRYNYYKNRNILKIPGIIRLKQIINW